MAESLLASRFVRVALSVACVLLAIIVLATPYRSELRHLTSSRIPSASTSTSANAIHNRTLGFQKVFAIGFSSRSDKRDAMSVASSFSNFDITWQEGVLVDDMPDKAIPEVLESATFLPSAIGAWRAHLNVLQTIVNEHIETAFILEDDVDWDVNLKSQLETFAKGVRALQEEDEDSVGSPSRSPYGHNWDVLWPGHCHTGPRDVALDEDPQQRMYFIYNDTTVPPYPHRNNLWENRHIMPEVLSNDTRIIFRTGSSTCSWGYGITLKAARKVITALSLEARVGRQFDGALSQLAHEGYVKSYTIYPSLLGNHRFRGSAYRDSDIHDHLDDPRWHEAYSQNIVYSTMLNMPRFEDDATDALSQWPNDTISSWSLDRDYGDYVTGELRTVDLKTLKMGRISGVNLKGKLDEEQYHGYLSKSVS